MKGDVNDFSLKGRGIPGLLGGWMGMGGMVVWMGFFKDEISLRGKINYYRCLTTCIHPVFAE